MRLNVYLQQAGVGSRREAERLVEQGRIKVNGAVATATVPVNDGDKVELDGKPLSPATRSQPRLFLLYKPLDVLVDELFQTQGCVGVAYLCGAQLTYGIRNNPTEVTELLSGRGARCIGHGATVPQPSASSLFGSNGSGWKLTGLHS